MKKLCVSVVLLWLVSITNVVAFEKGWVLNVKANVGGSLTLPAIAQDDLDRLGAQSMKGSTGFIGGGRAEIGYILTLLHSSTCPETTGLMVWEHLDTLALPKDILARRFTLRRFPLIKTWRCMSICSIRRCSPLVQLERLIF